MPLIDTKFKSNRFIITLSYMPLKINILTKRKKNTPHLICLSFTYINTFCLSFRYDILYVLQVREGSELIERLCGNALPDKMQIFPETTIILSFRSDSSVARSGFRAVWNIGKLRSVPRL